MIQEFQIRVTPQEAFTEESIKRYIATEKGLDVRTLNQVRVLRRSIDARQRQIYVNLSVRVYIRIPTRRTIHPDRISKCGKW